MIKKSIRIHAVALAMLLAANPMSVYASETLSEEETLSWSSAEEKQEDGDLARQMAENEEEGDAGEAATLSEEENLPEGAIKENADVAIDADPILDGETEDPEESEVRSEEPADSDTQQEEAEDLDLGAQSEEAEDAGLSTQSTGDENEDEEEPEKKNGLIEEGGQTYYYVDGVLKTGQKKIEGYWYMFDPEKDGAMVTGFYSHTSETNPAGGPKVCYYDESGHMLYGQKKIDGFWYNFKQGSGAMQTGFVNIPSQSKIVYYNKDGEVGKGLGQMLYGQKKIDGFWYMFKHGTGAMQTGFVNIPSQKKIVYYNEAGTMGAGLGQMLYGQKKIGGYWYMFKQGTGAMQTGFVNIPSQKKIVYYNEAGAMGSGLGRMQYGQKKIGGYWYMFKQGTGAMQTGFVNIPSQNKMVYYNEAGAMANGLGRMLYGAQKIGGVWHYLKPGSGALAGTGVFQATVEGVNGNWYFVNGKADLKTNRAVTYSGADWNVLNNRATRVGTSSDTALFKALKVIASITNDSMTKEQKLRKAFDHIKTFGEANPWIPHYKGVDWPQKYANHMLDNRTSNCFGYAATFAYLAKACGYTQVYAVSSGGHGWAEIDGRVYDPEWSKHYNYSTYYGISYDTKTDVNYKGALNRNVDWMYVKI